MFSRAYKTVVTAPPLLWVGVFLLVPYAADVLLQLLVGLAESGDRAFVESGELQRTAAEDGLLANPAAFHVDRGARDDVLLATGISAGIFPFVLRRQTKRSAVSDGDHSALGQLSGAGVCVEDDPRL